MAGLLPKLHLNRHSPRCVLFTSSKYGGLSLPDTVVNQGVGQLTLLIGHLKLNDDTGDLIQSFVTHLQLHIGSATPVFQLLLSQYTIIGYIPSNIGSALVS